MPKIDLTKARRMKISSGEITKLKNRNFTWEKDKGSKLNEEEDTNNVED